MSENTCHSVTYNTCVNVFTFLVYSFKLCVSEMCHFSYYLFLQFYTLHTTTQPYVLLENTSRHVYLSYEVP